MNLFVKCMKYMERKLIQLCFLFILIILLCALAYFWLSPYPLPKAVNIEIQRNRSAAKCKQRLCINQWIQKFQSNANISQLAQMCPGYIKVSRSTNKTFELYQEQKVDWKFLDAYHGFSLHYQCHRKCGINGPFLFFKSELNDDLQLPKAWLQNVFCMMDAYTCSWWAYWYFFKIYFSYFSIPLTIIINYINLTTLLQLLGKGAGPALYLHTAEIVTDGLLNIIVGFHSGLSIFESFDRWAKSCGYNPYTSAFQSIGVVQRFVSFLNQVYLMGLLVDRYYALNKPFHYNAMTDQKKKKRAKDIILKILLGSITFYLPFFLFYTFLPTFTYWKVNSISMFWKENLSLIVSSLVTVYATIGLFLLIFQTNCAVLVEKKFRKFIKKSLEMNQESEVKLKKRERDKQLLLGGTIGLNIITGLISAVFNMVKTRAFYNLLNIKQVPWRTLVFYMADTVLTFINGNGAMVIHVIFVKSYRKAFKATRFGKLIFRNQQVNPAQQHH